MPAVVLLLKKYWFHIACAVAVIYFAIVAYGKIYQSGYEKADGEWLIKWSDQATKLAENKADAEKREREKEQEWQSKINEVTHNAETQIHFLEADLAAANNSAVSLREQAKRLAARASKACAGSATGSSGTTAEAAAMVLAELLARADEAAGELAEAFDRSRIAGLACESSYDALKEKSPQG